MTQNVSRSSPWLWEELNLGLSFEPQVVTFTEADAALWRSGLGIEKVGNRSLLVPMMMRAFIAATEPRPPGNIHVSQELDFTGRAPQIGDRLIFGFTIGERTERKGRGWVDILIDCHNEEDGARLMGGKMVLIWAGRRTAKEIVND